MIINELKSVLFRSTFPSNPISVVSIFTGIVVDKAVVLLTHVQPVAAQFMVTAVPVTTTAETKPVLRTVTMSPRRNVMKTNLVPWGAVPSSESVAWALIVRISVMCDIYLPITSAYHFAALDCGEDNCVSSCDQKGECDPGDWGSDYVNATTCPLNVCCSKYGFCGTTEEFCGTKTVKRPSCNSSRSPQRVVGYYEGWAPTRPCKAFWPEMIPPNVYTHLNYAFATIDPETFEVLSPNLDEADLMKRLTGLKDNDNTLKVNIAIGGWSFNDPGPTASIFSDLSASDKKQKKFFKSLISFMSTYNFDGVDIDWEYPAADDRNGRPEDFHNFPKFMANLKKALQSTGGRDGLSLTLPTSYWYLQHFDIKSLAKHVDYFNYMSYDLHGEWDKVDDQVTGNKWTGAFLDGHTNLTEIRDVMDLLWRNDISPDQVVLGLAFYARGFTVRDTNCNGQTGVLLNGEIDDIRAERGIKPTLDKEAAVQILTWDDQWVAYDDAETFKIKTDFVKETCLGGVMVWAVSHDTTNGTYTDMLSGMAPINYQPHILLETGAVITDSGLNLVKNERNRQCKWTGCGETCPSSYVIVNRNDAGARHGEIMFESITCPKGQGHTLCCPRDHGVVCGWYGHNNGKCDSKCLDDMFEIGSIREGLCNTDGYQPACCTKGKDAVTLYNQLEWSTAPECDDGECPAWSGYGKKNKILGSSSTGSGDVVCIAREVTHLYEMVYTQRKLCYDDSVSGKKWENCQWYNNLGPRPKGSDDSYCTSTCPSGMVRVAMDGLSHHDCKNGGWQSLCCDDNYVTQKTYTNPAPKKFQDALKSYLVAGSCPVAPGTGLVVTRDILGTYWDGDGPDSKLEQRAKSDNELALQAKAFVLPLLGMVLTAKTYSAVQESYVNSWDDWVKSKGWSGLVMTTLKPYFQGLSEVFELGIDAVSESIMSYAPGIPVMLMPTLSYALVTMNLGGSSLARRNFYSLDSNEQGVLDQSNGKTYKVWSAADEDWISNLKYYPFHYPAAGDWTAQDTPYKRARSYQNPNDCANPHIFPRLKQTGDAFATEHIFELQNIAHFIEYSTNGKLVSGNTPNFEAIDASFFLTVEMGGLAKDGFWSDGFFVRNTALFHHDPGKDISSRAVVRLMGALGSKTYKDNFYLLEDVVNGMKARIFGNVNLVEPRKWQNFMRDTTLPGIPLKSIKAAIAVWHYLTDQEVENSWKLIVGNLRDIFEKMDGVYNNGSDLLVPAWEEWWCDWVNYQFDRSEKWIADGIAGMRTVWNAEPNTHPWKTTVLDALAELEKKASEILDEFDPAIFGNCS
ncbi:Glycoside hydrolase superfamily [Penicillium mononematosum]|uniref:Glycoside hydrolase superfamily n=1 Tax=Penicillium mononematosum TaxID=268346 RepID=UPI00254956F2|nr:Glycoside hydrolase superfamily [Penicillium mononematosum]KAJ6191606.1 Glycoside hydrolase superfamily [Penicillium mononematosum]